MVTLSIDVRVEGATPDSPRLQARFEVPPGVTVLYGPSGAGKSTCLSAVAGLLVPARGRIALGADVLFDTQRGLCVPAHLRRVALVQQSLALFPHLSVLENVAYGVPRGAPRAERRARAQAWLAKMRVGGLSAQRPEAISGGEAQRVALARALAMEPRALLLDEPFSALDVELRRELSGEVHRFVEELQIPALLVTHEREDVRVFGERSVEIRAGRLGT